MSAVSNSVMPRSIALWITLREASRSMRMPKLLQPMPTAETRRPEPPRLRISMWDFRGKEGGGHCDAPAPRPQGAVVPYAIYRAGLAGPVATRYVVQKKMRARSDARADREQ